MYDRIQHLRPKSFKRKCGVRRDTFEKMVEVLKPKLTRSGKRGGQGKFKVEDQLLIAMEYWREYRTQLHIGQSWGIDETTVGRMVRKIETILIQSGEFSLLGKKHLYQPSSKGSVLLVDVTECPIERPKKNQRLFYSGKQRWHTLKAQVVVDYLTRMIVCTAFGQGRNHDFRLFKDSKLPTQLEQLWVADSGYQGMTNLHADTCTPVKKSRHQRLSKADQHYNQQIAQVRIVVEHTNRKLKVFRILSERYRNRRKRFGLRFNLIAGLLNYELAHPI
ncbi:IS5 family transposase [Phormidesmis sp. 146-12]